MQLDLTFARRIDGGTALTSRHVAYPYTVTAPVRLPGTAPGPARLILQSASGGLYAGERLGQTIKAGPSAAVTIECPGATVVHGMGPGLTAALSLRLEAAEGSRLSYLTRPLILFPEAALDQHVVLRAAAGASILYREGFCLHDPGRTGRAFRHYRAATRIESPTGGLLVLESASVDGAELLAGRPGVAGPFRAFGSVYLVRPMPEAAVSRLKTELMQTGLGPGTTYTSATALRRGCGLMVRIAARDGGALADGLAAASELLEGACTG